MRRLTTDTLSSAVLIGALVFALLAVTLIANGMWEGGRAEGGLYVAAALAWLFTVAGLVSALLNLLRR
ncbi:MAG: hypothetical protein B7Z80_01115 [Rhodospirillales bacterium 20-64-7]|nr:MAG: hypothetical protein B7Z80_01115 [Rhodospirillales bacterium 20-64-7]